MTSAKRKQLIVVVIAKVNQNSEASQILKVKQDVKRSVEKVAGAHRSRTYHRHRRVPTDGFEVRGAHRDPSAPVFSS